MRFNLPFHKERGKSYAGRESEIEVHRARRQELQREEEEEEGSIGRITSLITP